MPNTSLRTTPLGHFSTIPHPADSYLPGVETANTIIFQFTAQELCTVDLERFLFLFGVDRPNLSAVPKLRGNVCIVLPDSPTGRTEPFLCDSTRRFCRAFFARFPYWAYFFSLQNMALWKMTLALVENSSVLQFDEPWKTKVILPPNEIGQIVSQQVSYATQLARQSEVVDTDELELSIRKYYSDLITSYCPR
ncbi:MAG: hypothetical protein QOH88_1739 [Verrucomicrobiota bacterium]|jgi:hypothetical protein